MSDPIESDKQCWNPAVHPGVIVTKSGSTHCAAYCPLCLFPEVKR